MVGVLVEWRAAGRLIHHGLVGLQDVQANDAFFMVDEGEADEIEGDQRFQEAAEIPKKAWKAGGGR